MWLPAAAFPVRNQPDQRNDRVSIDSRQIRSGGLRIGGGILSAAIPPVFGQTAQAQAPGSVQRGRSGLPLPRFVSLKSDRVNMRIGPGRDYAIEWLYLKSGLPLEIIQEYDNWRRVRDSEGVEGWIYQSLLSGRRTGMALPWHRGKNTAVDMRREPGESGRIFAVIEPGAIGRVHLCNGDWCRMTFKGHKGWVRQASIWGVYPGETYEE